MWLWLLLCGIFSTYLWLLVVCQYRSTYSSLIHLAPPLASSHSSCNISIINNCALSFVLRIYHLFLSQFSDRPRKFHFTTSHLEAYEVWVWDYPKSTLPGNHGEPITKGYKICTKLLRAYQLRSNGVIFLVKCTVYFSLQQYASVGWLYIVFGQVHLLLPLTSLAVLQSPYNLKE